MSGATSVTVPGLGTFTSVTPLEVDLLKQQTLMRFNTGIGYWIYNNPNSSWVTGLAPTIECHYSTTVEDARLLNLPLQFFPGSSADLTVGNLINRRDVVNLTLGTTASISDRGLLAFGYVVPLSTGDNRPFDYELTVQFSWVFGGFGSRAQRAY